jgi:hypothetical protein
VTPLQFKVALAKLAAHERAKLWKLEPLALVDDSAATKLAEEMRDVCWYIEDKRQEEEQTEGEDSSYVDFIDVLKQAASEHRLFARWEGAKRGLVENEDQIIKGQPIVGMYIEEALLRHSCNPNCFTNPYNNNIISVYTTRAVAAGEELTTSLIQGPYFKTAAYRRDELLHLRGLSCVCEACDATHPNFYLHEALRANIHDCTVDIDKFIEWQDELALRHHRKNMQSTEAVTIPEEDDHDDELRQLIEVEQKVLTSISHLQEIGCDTPDIIRFYIMLIDRVSPRMAHLLGNDNDTDMRVSHLELTFRSIQECARVIKKCCGTDHPMIEQFRQRGKMVMEAIVGAKKRKEMLEASRAKLAGLVRKEVKDEQGDIEMKDAADDE